MADTVNEAELQRRREQELEEWMEQQEQEQVVDGDTDEGEDEQTEEEAPQQMPELPRIPLPPPPPPPPKKPWLSYRTLSVLAFVVLVHYAFRSRRQYYLAMVYLGSSKIAYVVLANFILVMANIAFDVVVRIFFNGLRQHEAESLQDFFRWNVTETCLALTMFRQELTISIGLQFILCIVVKCLHHVAQSRESHLRLTEESVRSNFPFIKYDFFKLYIFLGVLQFMDLYALNIQMTQLLKTGPTVRILFAFEFAIMLVSAWSRLLLFHLHLIDSTISVGCEEENVIAKRLLHPWKEYKSTFVFAVELQAQIVQFMFYSTFFAIVLTYYGMPINLFREVYVSFMALKERLSSFLRYRQLMASMNRFASPEESDLQESGNVCIICRDEMTIVDSKRLPCGHMFHQSCLREWLVQQQSCPTCRSDISSMEATLSAARAGAAAAELRDQLALVRAEGDDPEEGGVEEGEEEEGEEVSSGDNVNDNTVIDVPNAMDRDESQRRTSEPAIRRQQTTTDDQPSLAEANKEEVAASEITTPGTYNPKPLPYPCLFEARHETNIFASDLMTIVRSVPYQTLLLGVGETRWDENRTDTFVEIPDDEWVPSSALRDLYEFRSDEDGDWY